jgi:hypothetical protein
MIYNQFYNDSVPSNDLWPHKINGRDETVDLIGPMFIDNYYYYIGNCTLVISTSQMENNCLFTHEVTILARKVIKGVYNHTKCR